MTLCKPFITMKRLFQFFKGQLEQENPLLMACIRSLEYIAKGCASTGLAAAVYDDFNTAHKLFCIPVYEDEEEYDQEGDFQCRLYLAKKNAQHK